jgi:hypothetical protein
MDDDFEIEVTDLNTGAPVHHPLASPGSDAADPRESNPDDPDDPDALDASPPYRPRSTRQVRLRAAIISGVVLLAVVLVFIFNPMAHSSLYTVFGFPTPEPSPTPLPGRNMVYLERGAPWGSVSLDGKRREDVNLGLTSPLVTLTPGHHRLTVTQQPFPTLSCTISSPAARRDTCPLISPTESQELQFGNPAALPTGSRIVNLGARFDRLPADEAAALEEAVGAQILPPSTPTTIRPGEHYQRDDGSVAVASEPLMATFVASLEPPDRSTPSSSELCDSFCDVSGSGQSNGGTWDIRVRMNGAWRVTAASGKVVVSHAPLMSSTELNIDFDTGSYLEQWLGVLWSGRWQVNARSDYSLTPICDAASQMVSIVIGSTPQLSVNGVNTHPARLAEQGCLVAVSVGDDSSNTSTSELYLYYRLGVLLAANDAAAHTFPTLPVASSSERALAVQIVGATGNS